MTDKEEIFDEAIRNLYKAYEEGFFCKGCKYENYASCEEHFERCEERIKEMLIRVREKHNKEGKNNDR